MLTIWLIGGGGRCIRAGCPIVVALDVERGQGGGVGRFSTIDNDAASRPQNSGGGDSVAERPTRTHAVSNDLRALGENCSVNSTIDSRLRCLHWPYNHAIPSPVLGRVRSRVCRVKNLCRGLGFHLV